MQIVAAIIRFFQILFAAVVLGLSVNLAKGQAPKDARSFYHLAGVPATTEYSAVTGGFGMVVAVIGFASLFVELLQGIIMMILDGLAGLLFVAGGIAVAVGLKGVSCSNSDAGQNSMFNNDLINGGCNGKSGDDKRCWYGADPVDRTGSLKPRCQMQEADSAFMFMAFIVCAGLLAHTFWFGGRVAGRKSMVV